MPLLQSSSKYLQNAGEGLDMNAGQSISYNVPPQNQNYNYNQAPGQNMNYGYPPYQNNVQDPGKGLAIAALVLSIIQTVYQYKAYYNLYASCKPSRAVLFLVLSILTPVGPFLVYACRNSDEGMPPEQAPLPESLQ